MVLQKNQETVESLLKKCNEGYNKFMSCLNLANHKDYHSFKVHFREDSYYLMKEIAFSKDIELKVELLKHLKEQLDFINDNPLSPTEEKLSEFIENNYPYRKKVEEIKIKYDSSRKNNQEVIQKEIEKLKSAKHKI